MMVSLLKDESMEADLDSCVPPWQRRHDDRIPLSALKEPENAPFYPLTPKLSTRMFPSRSSANAGGGGGASTVPSTLTQWVDVTWMPHTTLAQTSHVSLMIRSAHATLDPLLRIHSEGAEEWRIRTGIYGVGGLPLVPITTLSPTAPLTRRKRPSEDPLPQTTTTEEKSDASRSPSRTTSRARWTPSVSNVTHDCQWDYYAQIPIRWRDLPRDAYLRFEVLSAPNTVLYEATIPFFTQYGRLTTGLQRAELHESPYNTDAGNPGLVPLRPRSERNLDSNGFTSSDPVWAASCILDQLDKFEERGRQPTKAGNAHSFGQIPSVPWLDALMRERAMEMLEDGALQEETPIIDDDSVFSLIVEFPVFDIPILYEETFYPTPTQGASGVVTPLDLTLYQKQRTSRKATSADTFDPLEMVTFLDYEDEHDNPVEDKYRTLAHDLLRGLVDPSIKPDRAQRDRLASIIDSTAYHLTLEERDLLWRFRFSLVDNRRALTKFLLAVDWTVDSEVVQAAELLEQWRKRSPIEVTDALKLLGKHVAFQTNLVRSYAIDTLEAAPDSELRLYLLQLVQALKYENSDVSENGSSPRMAPPFSPQATQVSSLATFLINRAAGNIELANYLYWYLKVELENPTHGSRYREVFLALKTRLSETPFQIGAVRHVEEAAHGKSFKSLVDTVSSKIEKVSSKIEKKFRSDEKDRSSGGKSKPRTVWEVLVSEDEFITGVLDIQQQCRDARGKKDAKEEQLRSLLAKEGYDKSPSRDPIPLPTAPDIFVNGVHPETAKIFKSALYPALIDFHVDTVMAPTGGSDSHFTEVPSSHKVIVKTGDDLRQDQLIIMMIQLMDGILKKNALDLCLTRYSILATSPNSGLVEFVEGAVPISQILSQHSGSIMQFFQTSAAQKGAKYGVRPDVLSTYIRSCAGYCVITYLLGVGDRHLDNILLRDSGHLMHIDFGFIFGRDPKPLPPAFRLTREMVDGMGGVDSSEYRQFCSLSCQAFNALRKSTGLVLNLLHLMSDADIEDLSNNPSADAEGVLAKVEERFRLDLTDEQAERYFVGLINDCLAALAPRVMDVFHSFSVARR